MGSTITINEDGAMIHHISFAEQEKPRELA